MASHVDDLRPESMLVPIGQAMKRIEACVAQAHAWQEMLRSDRDDGVAETQLRDWLLATETALKEIYLSPANKLRFAVADPETGTGSLKNQLTNRFNRRCGALLDERESLLQRRDEIAADVADVQDRITRDNQLIELVQQVKDAADETWVTVCATPKLAPPLTRLLSHGISSNALWDILKVAVGVLARAAT